MQSAETEAHTSSCLTFSTCPFVTKNHHYCQKGIGPEGEAAQSGVGLQNVPFAFPTAAALTPQRADHQAHTPDNGQGARMVPLSSNRLYGHHRKTPLGDQHSIKYKLSLLPAPDPEKGRHTTVKVERPA